MGDQNNFERVLIANRGEIAIRIARAAASLGIESVAVHSSGDANALHVALADRAVELPGDDGVGAYLDQAALIEIALANGCDCVHPGYGFLAENAEFADACAAESVTFIGPSPDALRLFGDKTTARALAVEHGVPVVEGSDGALVDAAAAADVASAIGYPVMLKATAGGGGRGMRVVNDAAELEEAFVRASSEAAAAFGDGSMFVERLVARPRHIEVQVVADHTGDAVHLRERDCSVQLRNQKVVEVAPAVGLDPSVLDALHRDALTLTTAADYTNAGTVEFLVDPDAGTHHFIECNPRIQVEHTITEEVMGVDLVAAQFAIAAGMTLQELGLDAASAAGPRGAAVQARVVAGGGTIDGYREPSGPGVRIDGHGYDGYAPHPAFDPLLAKVVASGTTVQAAAAACERAVAEFHIGGVDTNLAQLAAILRTDEVRTSDARTSLLTEQPDLVDPPATDPSRVAALFGVSVTTDTRAAGAQITVPDGAVAIECPTNSQVLSVEVGVGDQVAAGQTLVVVTAMKMETALVAPTSGTVAAIADIEEGASVAAGQTLVAIEPSGDGSVQLDADQTWQPLLDEVAALQALAHERLAPGSEDPGVVRQRSRGKLTCRERIDLLLDDGSFQEVGSLAGFASYDDDGNVAAFTPANHVGGTGTIDGRRAIVCADDFTSRGGHADGAIGAKSMHLDMLAVELATPSIRLLDGSSGGGSVASMVPEQKKDGDSSAKESSGAIKAGRPRVSGGGGSFLPGHLGSSQYAHQLATIPVVNMLLGSVVGIGAAKAVLGHFSVMVRDISQLFVAGPPVVSHAMGYDITKEDLGDWRIHCTNGSVDNLAETEEEAVAMTRRFLSYLPSSVHEAPPVLEPDPADPADRREEELFTLIPRKRTTTFDVRRAIELMADRGSFFEIGPLWGTDQVTGFARFNGHPVGILASDSRHVNGGALTADGCAKLTRHIDLCDLFHIPVLNLVDNPGFAVGLEHEIAGTIRKGGEWMVAFAQSSVPLFTVIMRRSFGVAGNNYATPRRGSQVRVAWPAADVGGIPPEGGIEAAYKRQLAEADDPVALRAELEARIESARGPVGPLNRFQMEEMIDPRDTRRRVCDWVPTAYDVVRQAARLGPRDLQFRP